MAQAVACAPPQISLAALEAMPGAMPLSFNPAAREARYQPAVPPASSLFAGTYDPPTLRRLRGEAAGRLSAERARRGALSNMGLPACGVCGLGWGCIVLRRSMGSCKSRTGGARPRCRSDSLCRVGHMPWSRITKHAVTSSQCRLTFYDREILSPPPLSRVGAAPPRAVCPPARASVSSPTHRRTGVRRASRRKASAIGRSGASVHSRENFAPPQITERSDKSRSISLQSRSNLVDNTC